MTEQQRSVSANQIKDFNFARLRVTVEEQVASSELRSVFMNHVQEFADGLGERERQIMERRILADEPDTLQKLGEEFGVSRERVRQLEARLVEKLRSSLLARCSSAESPPAGMNSPKLALPRSS